MTESVAQKIARLEAEIAALKAQHGSPPAPRATNIVSEPRVTITVGDDIRSGDLPTEAEVDKMLEIVERAGQLARTDSRAQFRHDFVAAVRFLASVGRSEGVNMKVSAHDWALHGERYMSELGRSVSFTSGALWAAAIACGVPWQLGYQDRGIPARLGLVWDSYSGTPRAHSRWRQVLAQGKPLPPISISAQQVESERAAPVTIRLDRSVSGMRAD